jgi:hypothetical protein
MAQDDIQGQVVDAQGNPVDGAIVELTKSYQSSPLDEQVVRRTTTDANGNYIFEFHPDGDGTTQEWHVSCYNHDGTAYVNSFNNPGVTADLPSNAIPDSVVSRTTDNDSLSTNGSLGVRIETSQSWPLIRVEISANSSGYSHVQIFRISDGVLIGETDISSKSSGDIAEIDASLSENTLYNIVLVNKGGSYTSGYYNSSSYPYTSPDGNLSIVGGAAGAQSTAGDTHGIQRVGNL